MNPKTLFDQCGLVIYQDSDNWMKASLEYEDENISKLGCVVTNYGFSDWSSKDVPATVTEMWYRLSRRGQDFCVEASFDGIHYEMMRILHMHKPLESVNVGIYACSPQKSSVVSIFTDMKFTPCEWKAFQNLDLEING